MTRPHFELCPRCEEGILVARQASQEIEVAGSQLRIPDVWVEECPSCGLSSWSGREVALLELLPHYESVGELVEALTETGSQELFLREEIGPAALAFGSRDFVASLPEDMRELYLDHEASLLLQGIGAVGSEPVRIETEVRSWQVELPRLGEGENGIVYALAARPSEVLKIAKPRAYSRHHLRDESRLTERFQELGVPVPGILESDPLGSFLTKERLAGESLSALYPRLGPASSVFHRRVRDAVKGLAEHLVELFERYPEIKTSISPNNIFVQVENDLCRCLLVDTGPAPLHDYSAFDFDRYWEEEIPRKIERYRSVGYL